MGAQAAGGRGHRTAPAPARLTTARVTAASASALAVFMAAAGAILLAARVSEPPGAHDHGLTGGVGPEAHAQHGQHGTPVYEVGGVQLTVQNVAWMSHDMFGGPAPAQNNFPMPAQMMPGMQSDDVNRLHVELTLTNRTGGMASLVRKSFAAESAAHKLWRANPGDPESANLPPGASMSIDLYFDVPLHETVANILFTNAGGLVRILFDGAEPQHQHGY